MNKKGGLLGTSNTLALATVIIAIIMIASFFFITILGKPSGGIQAAEYSNKVQVRNALLTYLDTPVEVDGVKMEMTDLILIASNDSSYIDDLELETKKSLGEVYSGDYGIVIKDVLNIQYMQEGVSRKGILYSKDNLFSETVKLPRDLEVKLTLIWRKDK